MLNSQRPQWGPFPLGVINTDEMYGLQDVGEALSLYTKAIGVFMWFDRGRNKDNEDIPLVNTLGSKAVAGSSQEEVDKVRPDTTLLTARCRMLTYLC